MDTVKVKIKTLPHYQDLPLPSYQTAQAAGMDLPAAINEDIILPVGEYILLPTGICIELPDGYEAQVRPRSGLAAKSGIGILNSPGTIDADYRGEIKVILINHSAKDFLIQRGMRIAQMVIAPIIQCCWEQEQELSASQRAEGGFGHTGCR